MKDVFLLKESIKMKAPTDETNLVEQKRKAEPKTKKITTIMMFYCIGQKLFKIDRRCRQRRKRERKRRGKERYCVWKSEKIKMVQKL